MAEEVADDYRSSLGDLTFNSKPIINVLTMIAEENKEHAPAVVQVIEEHIKKVSSSKKLPVLYLIDSIIKNIADGPYLKLFCQNLVTVFVETFDKVDEKTRQSMYKLRQTWTALFPNSKMYALDIRVNQIDPAWPVTAKPPETGIASIHVNPKFLLKRHDEEQEAEVSKEQQEAAAAAAAAAAKKAAAAEQERQRQQKKLAELEAQRKDELERQERERQRLLLELKRQREEEQKRKEEEDQEKLIREQLLAKQQELLRLQQEKLELELQEAKNRIEMQAQLLRANDEVRQSDEVKKAEVKAALPQAADPPATTTLSETSCISTRDPRQSRDPRRAAANVSAPTKAESASKTPSVNTAAKDEVDGTAGNTSDGSNKQAADNSADTSNTQDTSAKVRPNDSIRSEDVSLSASSAPGTTTACGSQDKKATKERSVSPVKRETRSHDHRRSTRESSAERESRSDRSRRSARYPARTRDRQDARARSRSRSPASRGPRLRSTRNTRSGNTDETQPGRQGRYARGRTGRESPERSAKDNSTADAEDKQKPSSDHRGASKVRQTPSPVPEGDAKANVKSAESVGQDRTDHSKKRKSTSSGEKEPPEKRPKEEEEETRKLSDDLSGLFGKEDQDYRRLPPIPKRNTNVSIPTSDYQGAQPLPSPSQEKWSKFKASRPGDFPFAQPRTTNEIRRVSVDGEFRTPLLSPPTSMNESNGPRPALLPTPPGMDRNKHGGMLRQADKQLRAGNLTREKRDEIAKQLRELDRLQERRRQLDMKRDHLMSLQPGEAIPEYLLEAGFGMVERHGLLGDKPCETAKTPLLPSPTRPGEHPPNSEPGNSQVRYGNSPLYEDGDEEEQKPWHSKFPSKNLRGRVGPGRGRGIGSSRYDHGPPKRLVDSEENDWVPDKKHSHGLSYKSPEYEDTNPEYPDSEKPSFRGGRSNRGDPTQRPPRGRPPHHPPNEHGPGPRYPDQGELPPPPADSEGSGRRDLVLAPQDTFEPYEYPWYDTDQYYVAEHDPRWALRAKGEISQSHYLNLGQRQYQLPIGVQPRKVKWGPTTIHISISNNREVIIDNQCYYRIGEPERQVNINGRQDTIFVHGPSKKIWIDEQQYDIDVDAPPETVRLGKNEHRIQIDGSRNMVVVDGHDVCVIDEFPKQVKIAYNDYTICFTPPARKILIDGELCDLDLSGRFPKVNINNVPHGIRFDGPPKNILIDGKPWFVPVDSPRRARLGVKSHLIAFGGPGHEIIIDDNWYELKFGAPEKFIKIGSNLHSVRLEGNPPGVKILGHFHTLEEIENLVGPPPGVPHRWRRKGPRRGNPGAAHAPLPPPPRPPFIPSLLDMSLPRPPTQPGQEAGPPMVRGPGPWMNRPTGPGMVRPGPPMGNEMPVSQGPPMGPGANQRPPMGPDANQRPPMGPGVNQGPPMGPGANQGPPIGPGMNQGPPMGPGMNQGPRMRPGMNQGQPIGPDMNQGPPMGQGPLPGDTAMMGGDVNLMGGGPVGGGAPMDGAVQAGVGGIPVSGPGQFPMGGGPGPVIGGMNQDTMAPRGTLTPGQATQPDPTAAPSPLDVGDLFSKLVAAGILQKQEKKKDVDVPKADVKDEGTPKGASTPVLDDENTRDSMDEQNSQDSKAVVLDEVPDLTSLDPAGLKQRFEGVIQRMYIGIQCTNCGMRFMSQQKAQYREHLDWHFRANKREKDEIKVAKHRKWYHSEMDWIQYEEIGDLEERSQSLFFENMIQTNQQALPGQGDVISCPAASGEDDDVCNLCREPFEQFWDEDEEEWHLRDAIRVNNKTFHPICYEDTKGKQTQSNTSLLEFSSGTAMDTSQKPDTTTSAKPEPPSQDIDSQDTEPDPITNPLAYLSLLNQRSKLQAQAAATTAVSSTPSTIKQEPVREEVVQDKSVGGENVQVQSEPVVQQPATEVALTGSATTSANKSRIEATVNTPSVTMNTTVLSEPLSHPVDHDVTCHETPSIKVETGDVTPLVDAEISVVNAPASADASVDKTLGADGQLANAQVIVIKPEPGVSVTEAMEEEGQSALPESGLVEDPALDSCLDSGGGTPTQDEPRDYELPADIS